MQNFTFEGTKSRKRERIKRILQKKEADSHIPSSHICNSDKEEHCNLLVNRFINENKISEYENFVTVKNEYGVTKCVCLTLKPQLLPYPNLYDASDCAHFVANYFEYEALEDFSKAPEFLPSPSQVIIWRIADSFDLATVLTSFLLGSNYDAFVVYGVAPEWIYKRDLSKRRDNVEHIIPAKSIYFMEEAILAIQTMLGERNFSEGKTKNLISIPEKNGGEHVRSTISPANGIHSWVLIRPNARSENNLKGMSFIEPTTGIIFPCDHMVPYFKIYAIWNQFNYWVNLDPSNCTNFEIESDINWMRIFNNNSIKDCQNTDDFNNSCKDSFHLPLSWVRQKISIPKSEIQDAMYAPSNCRIYFLRNCKVELFSDLSNKQNLRIRISHSSQVAYTTESISEHFGHGRSDSLLLRVRLIPKNSFYEKFSSGNRHNIETWIEFLGVKRRINFASKTRADNLIEYEEEFGRTIKHKYEGRHDNLVQRVIHITWIDEMKEKVKDKLVLTSTDSVKNVVVLKVEDHFDQTGKIVGDDAISCRIFHFKDKILEMQCHHDRRVIRITKEFDSENLQLRQTLLDTEKMITTSVRSVHQEYLDILRTRRREEDPGSNYMTKPQQNLEISTDTLDQRNLTVTPEIDLHDYLSPFLMIAKDQSHITKEEAAQIYDSCLDSTKARLFERANIIQMRLDKETERLVKYQSEFNSMSQDASVPRVKEFEDLCRDINFKIEILKRRQKELESSCISRVKAVETKLRNDHRLERLFSDLART